MLPILNLIHWKNLLGIAMAQMLIKYALFIPFNINTSLNWFGFSLLILSTLCIAAAGYIINEIYEVESDLINRPNKVIIGRLVSEKLANYLFIIFNLLGVFIGFYLSHLVGKNNFFPLFVLISALLYINASYLKQKLLIGNIVVSALVAFSLLIVGVFELLPAIKTQNQTLHLTIFKVLLDYALFIFIINFIREIVKDVQDVNGDHSVGMHTLPIIMGRDRTRMILFALSFIPILVIIYCLSTYLYKYTIAVIYFLIFVVAPLIFISIKIYNAEIKRDYQLISKILKIVMLTGILSMLLFPLILK